MRRCCGSFVAFFFGLAGLCASEPHGKIVKETWEAAYLDKCKCGHAHTTVRNVQLNGGNIIKTEVELHLTVKRNKDLIRLRMETGTEESFSGKIIGVFMRQFVGNDQQVSLRGIVEGETLQVKVDGGRRLDKKIPWNDQVVGLNGLDCLFANRETRPGDRFSYLFFDPTYTAILAIQVTAKDFEEVLFPGNSTRARLLRVEAVPDKIGGMQPAPVTWWLDDQGVPVHSQTNMPGLGSLTLYRTTRQAALEQSSSAPVVNIGLNQLISTRRIARPYDREYAVYRVTIKDDANPATTFARDSRQEIKNVQGNSFELHVRASRQIAEGDITEDPGPEFRKSCHFINSDDARVRDHARSAVGSETDAWLKARMIERWVHTHMKKESHPVAFAPADEVARTLQGDCSEYAMLTAAMCRAAGIPSRAVVGLLYVDSSRGPAFGFHMWTEVWVQGRWVPIDGTLGRGFVGATHLKISDHSWYETKSLTPLLPATRLAGKTTIEVEK